MTGKARTDRPNDGGAPRRSRLTLGELANVWVELVAAGGVVAVREGELGQHAPPGARST